VKGNRVTLRHSGGGCCRAQPPDGRGRRRRPRLNGRPLDSLLSIPPSPRIADGWSRRPAMVRWWSSPVPPMIEFRIGIHVGDIMIDGNDILGDGVNIAGRLESIADPGGIVVSARVYEDTAAQQVSQHGSRKSS
jgi:Adenylate and Guanylate cyclase catalytic domain